MREQFLQTTEVMNIMGPVLRVRTLGSKGGCLRLGLGLPAFDPEETDTVVGFFVYHIKKNLVLLSTNNKGKNIPRSNVCL